MNCDERQLASIRKLKTIGFILFSLCFIYAITTGLGFASLKSQNDPIGDPYFTIMEILILIISPILLIYFIYTVFLRNDLSIINGVASIVFITAMTIVTSIVHFSILAISRPIVQAMPIFSAIFSFTWPSFLYASDILAWDIFFPIACYLLIPYIVISNTRTKVGKIFWVIGTILSAIGIIGVPLNSMQIRLIGVVGYAVFTPISILLISLGIKDNK